MTAIAGVRSVGLSPRPRCARLAACSLAERWVELWIFVMLGAGCFAQAAHVLVEAESFEQLGGWKLDTQFVALMGSPYLLAHGLGEPVTDAVTTVRFPKEGTYRVFVRTKDWVARWNAPGQPGRFQLIVDGTVLPETFGTRGAEWFWHDGGRVEIRRLQVEVALHDLTGFDGRCDAILFTDAAAFVPANDSAPLSPWRRQLAGLSEAPREAGRFDLVVVGGGYAGLCSAIAAARLGCRVALLQDRPVLGGNGSSEIRVWPQGKTRRGLYPRLGEIVEELADRPTQSPGPAEQFNDARREVIVRAETNITLFLNHYVYAVETNEQRIVAVVALDTRTGAASRFEGALFADCTGHGSVGFLAGADHTVQAKGHLGMSNMWRWKNADTAQFFPDTPWALDLRMKDFPYPAKQAGEWFWESGFDQHPIEELEAIRDWNLRAVFGAFNAMKNRDGQAQHSQAVLEWVAYVGGTRESRQLLGDVVLTRDDIVAKRVFADATVPSTWDIDLHYPEEKYQAAYPGGPFISRAVFDQAVDRVVGYPVPYRCFYSRNIDNLFMAGRCISVTHEALGTVRVMKTGGMMGEVVGKAASLCVKYGRSPRAIYHSHLDELKMLMNLPGPARRDAIQGEVYIPSGARVLPPPEDALISPESLAGIVVDNPRTRLKGSWSPGQNLAGFIGRDYLYHGPTPSASAQYEFTVPQTGRYEVRFSYRAHPNRASNTRVTVQDAQGAHAQRINQRIAPVLPGGFVVLGAFQFEAGQAGYVVVDNDSADGFVTIDAVQVVALTPTGQAGAEK